MDENTRGIHSTRFAPRPIPVNVQRFRQFVRPASYGELTLVPSLRRSLTAITVRLYRDPSRGAVAQLGEHKAGSLGVRGSNPLSSTI